MNNMQQYAIDKLNQTLKLHEAEQLHLAETVPGQYRTSTFTTLRINHKIVKTVSLVALFVLFLLVIPQTIHAQDKYDTSGQDAYYDQMMAFRLGHYYYVTGEYERAIEYYNHAIEGIPEAIFVQMSSFRDLYWLKGDAQLKAGQPDAAYITYQRYLQLAGNEAKEKEIAFVQTLETNLATGNVVMEPLEV